jgi:cytochrome c oxidase subunit 1
VALSIMGICYWLVPYFTGKRLALRRVAVLQSFLWFVGVLGCSRGQIMGGLDSMPRRTQIADAVYLDLNPSWDSANLLTMLGGVVMFVAGVLFFVVILATIFNNRMVDTTQEIPVAEVIHGPRETWGFLDRLGLWTVIAVVLSVVVYGITIWHYWPYNGVSPGIRLW